MKKVQVFKEGEEIPSAAKYLSGLFSKTQGCYLFFYDVSTSEPTTKQASKFKEEIEEIIKYLNEKVGGEYTSKAKATVDKIRARLNEGRTVEQFKKVIDSRAEEWLGDSKMNDYLRPQTLFGPKFDGYLTAASNSRSKDSALDDLEDFLKDDKR